MIKYNQNIPISEGFRTTNTDFCAMYFHFNQ